MLVQDNGRLNSEKINSGEHKLTELTGFLRYQGFKISRSKVPHLGKIACPAAKRKNIHSLSILYKPTYRYTLLVRARKQLSSQLFPKEEEADQWERPSCLDLTAWHHKPIYIITTEKEIRNKLKINEIINNK